MRADKQCIMESTISIKACCHLEMLILVTPLAMLVCYNEGCVFIFKIQVYYTGSLPEKLFYTVYTAYPEMVNLKNKADETCKGQISSNIFIHFLIAMFEIRPHKTFHLDNSIELGA